MPCFISLLNFTDQGARNIRESTARADAAIDTARKMGVEIKQMYWTLGGHDLITIAETKDGETYAAFVAAISSMGNVRGQSLRAFNKDEFAAILKKSTVS